MLHMDMDFVLPSGKKLRDATAADLAEAATHYFLEAEIAEDRAKELRQAAREMHLDGNLIAKAFAYAIEAIDGLPKERQDSDRNDMERFLKKIACEKFATTLRTEARAALDQRSPIVKEGKLAD